MFISLKPACVGEFQHLLNISIAEFLSTVSEMDKKILRPE